MWLRITRLILATYQLLIGFYFLTIEESFLSICLSIETPEILTHLITNIFHYFNINSMVTYITDNEAQHIELDGLNNC